MAKLLLPWKAIQWRLWTKVLGIAVSVAFWFLKAKPLHTPRMTGARKNHRRTSCTNQAWPCFEQQHKSLNTQNSTLLCHSAAKRGTWRGQTYPDSKIWGQTVLHKIISLSNSYFPWLYWHTQINNHQNTIQVLQQPTNPKSVQTETAELPLSMGWAWWTCTPKFFRLSLVDRSRSCCLVPTKDTHLLRNTCNY